MWAHALHMEYQVFLIVSLLFFSIQGSNPEFNSYEASALLLSYFQAILVVLDMKLFIIIIMAERVYTLICMYMYIYTQTILLL